MIALLKILIIANVCLIDSAFGSRFGLAFGQSASVAPAGVAQIAAETQYNSGNFATAATELTSIIGADQDNDFVNGDVLYNLGNAEFKSGHIGPAIAAYAAAMQLMPRNPDVRANLQFAMTKVTDKLGIERELTVVDRIFFWTPWFHPREQLVAAEIFFILFSLLFASLIWVKRQDLKMICQWSSALGLIAWIVTAGGFAYTYVRFQPMGSVVSTTVDVFSAPSREAGTKVFALNEGALCWLLESSGQWVSVELSDGKKGWVEASFVKFFLQ